MLVVLFQNPTIQNIVVVFFKYVVVAFGSIPWCLMQISEDPLLHCSINVCIFETAHYYKISLVQVVSKHQIAMEFLTHEAIIRRQPVIDQICGGLESLGFLDLLRISPVTFERAFTCDQGPATADKVIPLLTFGDTATEAESKAAKLLEDILREASSEG